MLKLSSRLSKKKISFSICNNNNITFQSTVKKPTRIALTRAAGQISYSLIFRIANGDMLGYDQPIILHLIDKPNAQKIITGVAMQLRDCAFPLLKGIVCTDKLQDGFEGVDIVLLIDENIKAIQMSDSLKQNAENFISQGQVLNDCANKNIKILCVGGSANTNALITSTYAKNIPKQNFCAMTQLYYDRTKFLINQKCGSSLNQIKKVALWGNNSASIFPDLTWTTVGGFPIFEIFGKEWYYKKMMPTIRNRGSDIVQARGLISTASIANAALNHIRSWFLGHDDWISFGIYSPGTIYNIPKGLFFSFPVQIKNGNYQIVKDLLISGQQKSYINKTIQQLLEQRQKISHILKI